MVTSMQVKNSQNWLAMHEGSLSPSNMGCVLQVQMTPQQIFLELKCAPGSYSFIAPSRLFMCVGCVALVCIPGRLL